MIDHPALPFLKRDEKGKVVSAADAVKLIRDGIIGKVTAVHAADLRLARSMWTWVTRPRPTLRGSSFPEGPRSTISTTCSILDRPTRTTAMRHSTQCGGFISATKSYSLRTIMTECVPADRGGAFAVGDPAALREQLARTIAAVRARGMKRLPLDRSIPDITAQVADFRARYAALARS